MMNKVGSAKPMKTGNFTWRILKFLSLMGGTEGQYTDAAVHSVCEGTAKG